MKKHSNKLEGVLAEARTREARLKLKPTGKRKTESNDSDRVFPVRMAATQLEAIREEATACGYSINHFVNESMTGIIELIRCKADKNLPVPKIVAIARMIKGRDGEAVKAKD